MHVGRVIKRVFLTVVLSNVYMTPISDLPDIKMLLVLNTRREFLRLFETQAHLYTGPILSIRSNSEFTEIENLPHYQLKYVLYISLN